jgi:phospholipid/cholesterol/gamma-HCH transport system permease protein
MQVQWDHDLTRETVREAYHVLGHAVRKAPPGDVYLALSDTARLDSAGAALLEQLRVDLQGRNCRLRIESASPSVRSVLSIYARPPVEPAVVPASPGLFERAGDASFAMLEEALSFLVLTADMGALFGKGLVRRLVPWRTFVEQCIRIGSQALPIVALISFLVGLTTALQAAYQLRQFGANIYIANLVGVAMLAEMGPLMTAILMAGRSGASIAAEIGSMVIAEEVDALKTMGVDPHRYVVLPRLYALVFTQPLLTAMATAIGIGGGLIVAVLYLDISVPAFWNQLIDGVTLKDLIQAQLKAVVFAAIIGLVAAHVGSRASGGATGVGRSATTSVVASIFLVIVADAIFSLLFYFGD